MPSRSGRHRAPSAHSRALSTMAAAGAALSASLLTPASALAANNHADHHGHASGPADRAGTTRHGTHHTRPMTSGERQYRNGCQQGYITEDCERFSVTELLHHGINPYL